MKKTLFALLCALVLNLAFAQADDKFFPELSYADGKVTALFTLLNPGEHIYDDMLACSLGEPLAKPQGTVDADGRLMYGGLVELVWVAQPNVPFTLDYQGCDATQCFMPQSYTFIVRADEESGVLRVESGNVGETVSHTASSLSAALTDSSGEDVGVRGVPPSSSTLIPTPNSQLPTFNISTLSRSVTGFVEADAFVRFLEGKGEPTFADDPMGFVREHGLWAVLLLIFLGGLALNLTPCVLPMMPINLAIIGAGAVGGSRIKGALRGGAYGLGIALAYGALALIPVFTGAAFGAVQSTGWFNAVIAIVFVLLALALFDIFMIDFTRFAGQGSGKQGFIAAFSAGTVSAVLAGACVAPVLIAVLLLTSTYVGEGAYWALSLPFLLGLGMALPWPIAGAGLAFLPKPGAWMVWVKKVFGIGVLLFAAYYGYTAYKAFAKPAHTPSEHTAIAVDGTDFAALTQAIAAAPKPVLLDFWGTACKNCDAMDAVTFTHPAVQEALKPFTFIKVKMELTDPGIKATQEAFSILGLPTYIIISN